jgi:hypothetical protein
MGSETEISRRGLAKEKFSNATIRVKVRAMEAETWGAADLCVIGS